MRVLIADDRPRSRDGLRALLATLRLCPSMDSWHSSGQAARLSASRLSSTKSHEAWPEVEVIGGAADGREAVRLVEECRPNVVLMDARMPAMDGLEATRLIKDRWPGCKVVVLTMYASYQADALAAGADAFLVKGCPAEELLEAIFSH
jgi:DNA-binding NarL/FixJ family response regulator